MDLIYPPTRRSKRAHQKFMRSWNRGTCPVTRGGPRNVWRFSSAGWTRGWLPERPHKLHKMKPRMNTERQSRNQKESHRRERRGSVPGPTPCTQDACAPRVKLLPARSLAGPLRFASSRLILGQLLEVRPTLLEDR